MLDPKVETFLCVCEEMNFTKAAKKLNITQPAVSMQIKCLEDYYQVPLFDFEGKRFTLTKYGKLIYNSLMTMQNNDKYLVEQINILKTRVNIINMGATKTVGEFMLSKHLSHYIKLHPESDISVSITNTHQLLSSLDSGIIDFAILEGDFKKSAYNHLPVIIDDFIPVCANCHHFNHEIKTISDLTDERLIIREAGSGTRNILETELENRSMSVENFSFVTTIGSMNAIIDLVRSDCGITFLYRNAVQDLLNNNILKEIQTTDFHVQHEISIVWNKNSLQNDYIISLTDDLFASL